MILIKGRINLIVDKSDIHSKANFKDNPESRQIRIKPISESINFDLPKQHSDIIAVKLEKVFINVNPRKKP